jgi:hypothetical protein
LSSCHFLDAIEPLKLSHRGYRAQESGEARVAWCLRNLHHQTSLHGFAKKLGKLTKTARSLVDDCGFVDWPTDCVTKPPPRVTDGRSHATR